MTATMIRPHADATVRDAERILRARERDELAARTTLNLRLRSGTPAQVRKAETEHWLAEHWLAQARGRYYRALCAYETGA